MIRAYGVFIIFCMVWGGDTMQDVVKDKMGLICK
jgi:hypothetical protein